MLKKDKRIEENSEEKRIKVKEENKDKKFRIWGKWYVPVIIAVILITMFVFANLGIELLKLPTLDFTSNGKYTVTDVTKDYIGKNLDKDVTIYLMYQRIDGVIPSQVDGIESFLLNYEKFSNGKIKLEKVDVSQNKDIAEKYGVSLSTSKGSTFSVVYECGENFKKIDEYGFYMREKYEEVSTNAILEIANEKREMVYFVEGYSTASLNVGYASLAMYMQKEVFSLAPLSIKLADKIPDDASVVVLCGLQTDLEENDLNKLLEFFENGGKILVLQQYVGKNMPNLQKLVGTVGIQFEDNLIYEGNDSNRLSLSACTIVPIYAETSLKQAMEKRQAHVIFDGASSLRLLNDEEMNNNKTVITQLLTTSDRAWTTTNYNTYLELKPANVEAGTRVVGAMGQKSPQGSHEGKIIVYTNDYFIGDEFISRYQGYGSISNIDFVIENLILLTGRTNVVNIDKNREYPEYKIYTSTTKFILEVISYSIPSLILIIGLVIWIYRKNRK